MQLTSFDFKNSLPFSFFKQIFFKLKSSAAIKKAALPVGGAAILLASIGLALHFSAKPVAAQWHTVPMPTLAPPASSAPAQEPLTADTVYYPTDTLFLSPQRQAYVNGTMLLTVPRLELENLPVQNGTTTEILANGVGLYEVSSMPSKGNPNVCIAGHRGVHGSEFADIDTFAAEDKIFLEYDGYLYTYLYEETTIVKDDDWSPIFCTDDSRITLTSCHPKTGASTHRICATGVLISVEPV